MGKMTDKNITQRYDGVMKKQAGKLSPYRQDGFVSVLNSYGTMKEMRDNYYFEAEPMVSDEEIEIFYEGDGLFARIIDMPSEEVVKNGFELENVTDEKLIDFYKEALDELDWEETAITAMKWTRLFGGALVVLLINDGRGLDEPVDWDNIKSIDDMVVYDRSLVTFDYSSMYSYEHKDPFKKRANRLGTPEYFYVFSQYGNFTVHESRCLIFRNGQLPERASNSEYQFWGLPEYPKVFRAIKNVELAQNSAPKMLDKSVQPVYSMKNLAQELATEGGEERLLKRLETIDTARGIMNTITVDAEGEDYNFRTFTFSGVADAINSSATYLSAVTNIPQVLLFGNPISGMSSTDDTAMEAYYNYIQRYQKKTVRSNLRYLLSIIFQAGVQTGEIDEVPDIRITFNPLWSLNENQQVALDIQKAQLEQIKAATALQYIQAQVIDPSEVRNSLADSSDFDVETMMDDYTEEELEEFMPKQEEGQDPMAAMMGAMGGGGMGGGMPDMGGNAPSAAPAATKLPEDMSKSEKETAETAQEGLKGVPKVGLKPTKPSNIEELRKKNYKHKDDGLRIDGGPGSGIKGHETPEDPAEERQKAVEKNKQYNMGNIDLTNRPKVSSEAMRKAGYDTEPGSVSTVYSSYDFFWQGGEEDGKWVCVHYTPIMQDGNVLSADDVYDYIASSAESGNLMDADRNGKRLVMNVEDVPCSEQEIDDFVRNGKSSPKLDEFMKKADQWDEDVHNAQEELYADEDDELADDDAGMDLEDLTEAVSGGSGKDRYSIWHDDENVSKIVEAIRKRRRSRKRR